LDDIFGTWKEASKTKKSYNLPSPIMSNTDLARLLKSDEIQKVLKAPKKLVHRHKRRLNPLKNVRQMIKLNPYAEVTKRRALLAAEKRKMERAVEAAKRRGIELPASDPAVKYLKVDANRAKQVKAANVIKKKQKAEKVAARKTKKAAKVAKKQKK